MNEIKDFITRLKEERMNLNYKLSFMVQHKFDKEAEYLRNKVDIINIILHELEAVASGHTKGVNAKFTFLNS